MIGIQTKNTESTKTSTVPFGAKQRSAADLTEAVEALVGGADLRKLAHSLAGAAGSNSHSGSCSCSCNGGGTGR